MIAPGTRSVLLRVPLERIAVTEHQARYPEQVLHYYRLLTDPANALHDLGPVSLAYFTPDDTAPGGGTKSPASGMFQLLDGHHRFLAHVLAGRGSLLGILHVEPGEPGYDTMPETAQPLLLSLSPAPSSALAPISVSVPVSVRP